MNALLVLFLTSPVDWLLMAIKERPLPRFPTPEDLEEEPGSSWYHLGKNVWTELFDKDPQWWSKFVRFIIWWGIFLVIII